MANTLSRRSFLQVSAAVASGLALSGFDFKAKPLLSFSTLGCPDWTFQQIVDFAAERGYQAIEVRGILRELDLTKCNEFSKAGIPSTIRLMKDKNLSFVDLGSSCTLHFPESEERKKNLDEGRRFIDLAHEINCPYVRVFPNNLPKDREKKSTMELIVKGLLELADHAKGSNVSVLIESHGDLVWVEDLESILKSASHEKVGMIWDITNMWTKTKESPSHAYEKLKGFIRHTHIKDAKVVDGTIHYVRLGSGEVPIFNAIDELAHGGYQGYYSFEWEKLWHPEIEAPEIAIADYVQAMNEHFK